MHMAYVTVCMYVLCIYVYVCLLYAHVRGTCMRTCVCRGVCVLCMCGYMYCLLVCVHRNALWCTQKHVNMLCATCKYMPKQKCMAHMYVWHVCVCVAHVSIADIHVSACDGCRYMHACMCDGHMCVHTCVCLCVMDKCVCMSMNVRWVDMRACLCVCVYSCVCGGKVVEIALCLQTTDLGHSYGCIREQWS